MMNYKGYTGKAEYDDDAGIFSGEVMGLRDVITFRGASVKELRASFEASIDDYMAFCKKMGKKPEAVASGRLVLRMQPDMHSKAAALAKAKGKSLNEFVNDAVRHEVNASF